LAPIIKTDIETMRFSQKIGKTPVRDQIQIEGVDTKLENKIWNSVLVDFFNKIKTSRYNNEESDLGNILKHIWVEFFEERIDEIPKFNTGQVYTTGVMDYIKAWFFRAAWYEKYDFIEFLSKIDNKALHIEFSKKINIVLSKEMSGYRIVDEHIVQITSNEEIQEIEKALMSSSKYESVTIHLSTALELLSNRENPDYRNSIKESISAVESLCIIITDDSNATLGKALVQIEKNYQIHGALKSAFSALYGYTSDSSGIRHALLEDDISVNQEDALFMLVSCSAFINYLRKKTE
jgi:hypothetical protein